MIEIIEAVILAIGTVAQGMDFSALKKKNG
jgi:hypothetical protein